VGYYLPHQLYVLTAKHQRFEYLLNKQYLSLVNETFYNVLAVLYRLFFPVD